MKQYAPPKDLIVKGPHNSEWINSKISVALQFLETYFLHSYLNGSYHSVWQHLGLEEGLVFQHADDLVGTNNENWDGPYVGAISKNRLKFFWVVVACINGEWSTSEVDSSLCRVSLGE